MAANMLDDTDVASAISNNNTTPYQDKVQLLIFCANQIANVISTDYLHIYKTKTIASTGSININTIDSNGIINIINVKCGGRNIDYEIVDGAIKTIEGTIKIKYTSQPTAFTAISNNVTEFPQVPARIFAYGVAAEYLYIKGNIEDANSWNNRFVSAIKGLQRGKNIVMPKRRWY